MARLYPEAAQNAAMVPSAWDNTITTPPQQNFDTPAMEGSMQQFLSENLGQYVVIEFLVGTQAVTTKAGVLYAVGTSVVTLYQELSQTFVTCDIFSIKFVTFYLPGHRPWQVNNPLFGQNGTASVPGMAAASTSAQSGLMGGPTGLGGGTAIAPGFAPPMDMSGPMGQGGCISGNCGGGDVSQSWG